MEAQWIADRTMLRTLLRTHPAWTLQDFADAVGRSRSGAKKWVKRLRAAAPDNTTVLFSQSRARKQPPPRLSTQVIERILEIRDHPPGNLHRTPGPKAILYYLHQGGTEPSSERLPRSTRTIWRILRQHSRIAVPAQRQHKQVERPAPLAVWQLDFKDASTVPADPEGKQQHVVEVLNMVDAGTSLVLNAQVRDDFTMETTVRAVAEAFQQQGLPDAVMVDRDSRFVGGTGQRDCLSPFERFCLCLGVAVTVLPPRRPDLNCFVERYHRAYEEECLRIFQPQDLGQVREVTERFTHHYNQERPHQGRVCGNQPPQVALIARVATVPVRPSVPKLVDPDRWVVALDGRRYVRKVAKDTRVMVDAVPYYLTRDLVGKYINLRVDAATREFVIEDQNQEVQRVPIKGLRHAPLGFDAYVEWICEEARADRLHRGHYGRQLRLPL